VGYDDSHDLALTLTTVATFFATSVLVALARRLASVSRVPTACTPLMAGTYLVRHEYPAWDSNHPNYAAPTIFRAMNNATSET